MNPKRSVSGPFLRYPKQSLVCRTGSGDTEKSPIEDDVARQMREIKLCKEQESRLVNLYQFGEIDDDLIKRQSAPLKLRREGYESELERLTFQQLTMAEMEYLEGRAKEYCRRMRQNLDSFGLKKNARP